jgi:hypothetical protein
MFDGSIQPKTLGIVFEACGAMVCSVGSTRTGFMLGIMRLVCSEACFLCVLRRELWKSTRQADHVHNVVKAI